MTEAKHIVLWGGWYGSHNVGDESLLLTVSGLLARTFGDVQFTVLSNDPAHVMEYTSQASSCHYEALHNRRDLLRVLTALATCDLLVFGGGAPFFETRKHLLDMAVIVGVARVFHTPYMTWTVASQIVQSKLAKRLFRWVLNGAAAITYRDQHTLELFESCGVNRPMVLAGDSGFWLEPESDQAAQETIQRAGVRDETRPLVALTPRTLRGANGDAETHYNIKSPAQFEQEIDCFAAALDWCWEEGYQPIFVPMNTVEPDDDLIAFRLVKEQAKHGQKTLSINWDLRPRLAPAIYRQCHFSFVARVHGSILSTVGGCPVMMYAFAPKHAGIMESMKLSEYCMLEAVATPARTVELLAGLAANRELLRVATAERLTELRQDGIIPAQLAAKVIK